MPRQRDPRRDEAFEIWKKHKGEITNRELAERLDVPEKTISAWKSRDKWNVELNVVLQKNERSTAKEKKQKNKKSLISKKDEIEPLPVSDELTDKQRLFCVYYIQSFNATKAYQKAYDCAYSTAMVNGHGLLRNTKVRSEIDRLKDEIAKNIMMDGQQIVQKYIDIAFANLTDFVEFGQREVIETDDDGNETTRMVNYVDFKNSDEIDGTIVTEVKKGKDGIAIKLADKMKALEMLKKYFIGDDEDSGFHNEVNVHINNINEQHSSIIQEVVSEDDEIADRFLTAFRRERNKNSGGQRTP